MSIKIKRIISIGIRPELSLSEKRSIRFTNVGVFLGVAFCLISIVINYVMLSPVAAIFPAVCFFLYSGIFYLQFQRKYHLAKVAGLSIGMLTIMFACWFFGINSLLFFMYLLTFTIGLVFFPIKQQQFVVFLTHLLCLAITIIGAQYIPSYVELNNHIVFGTLTFVFSMLLLFFVIQTYTTENQNFEVKTKALVDSLLKQRRELELEKQKVEEQALALTKANDTLKKEIQERKIIEQQLTESNEELAQFAYVASHDLKEPLRTVASFAQLLNRKLSGKLDKEGREYIEYVVDGARRMSNLLDDLLTYSKVGRKEKSHKESVDLNGTIEIVQYNLSAVLKSSGGTILKSAPLPIIAANRTQMIQLFQNLISNGLKFRNRKTPVINIGFEETPSAYVFSVKDNGIGIPKTLQGKIFAVFQRLHSKTEYEGTGIGLAICKKVVQNHGGQIWIESEQEKGAIFYFSIEKESNPV